MAADDTEDNGTTRRFRPVTGDDLADDSPPALANRLRFLKRDVEHLARRIDESVMPTLERILDELKALRSGH